MFGFLCWFDVVVGLHDCFYLDCCLRCTLCLCFILAVDFMVSVRWFFVFYFKRRWFWFNSVGFDSSCGIVFVLMFMRVLYVCLQYYLFGALCFGLLFVVCLVFVLFIASAW